MSKRITITSALLIVVLLWSGHQTGGQTPQRSETIGLAPPVVPMIIEYDFAPLYFSQWNLDDPHYSRISAIATEGDAPCYVVILSERSPERQIYYSNLEPKVAELKRAGKTAHKTAIDFRIWKEVEQPSTYGFGFKDIQGRTILWRFTPASRPSERGAGLTPLPSVPGLRLDYSELGTTAGGGTAVQIGDRVSEARPWPEISAPPYFVAFQGSHSEGRHLGALKLGIERWRIISAPNVKSAIELREGATWKILEVNGRELIMSVTARRNDEVTITQIQESAIGLPKLTIVARVMAQGFALREIRQTLGTRSMRIAFTPELNLTNASGSFPTEVNFEIDEGDHRRIAHGVVKLESQGAINHLQWTPRAPAWTKSLAFTSTIRSDGDGYVLEVSQAAGQSKL